MAVEQLDAFIGSNLAHERFVLLSDHETNGDFLTHYYIQKSLKGGHKLCIVSLLHPFSHYAAISSKLSVNLRKALDSGQVTFIDCLTETDAVSQNESVDWLYQKITADQDDVPHCIVLDDINVLLSLGWSLKGVVSLTMKLQRYIFDCLEGSHLVMMSHDQGEEDGDDHTLLLHLLFRANLHLRMEGLKTGYSKLVHGELIKELRDPLGATPTLYKTQSHSMQYRILERGIKLFAKGTSDAVL